MLERACALDSCKQKFVVPEERGMRNRRYCSRACSEQAKLLSAKRSYYKRIHGQELSNEELSALMRASHRRGSVQVDGNYDRKVEARQGHEPAKRRCTYNTGDEACITILCRYNPGPFCFMHAERISQQAMAEQERRLAVERQRNQLLMEKAA